MIVGSFGEVICINRIFYNVNNIEYATVTSEQLVLIEYFIM